MSVFLRFPYFLFSVPFFKFLYPFRVFRSKEIAEYMNTVFHVIMVIVAIVVTIVIVAIVVTVVIYLIFANFLIGSRV
jgi:hypothetical protein